MPDKIIHVDFARFTGAGFGTIFGPKTLGLQAGESIAVTDVDADTVEAEVLDVCGDTATIHVHWDRVLHRA
jgi:hypothetical protein